MIVTKKVKRYVTLSLILTLFLSFFNCVKVNAYYSSGGAVNYADTWALSRNPDYPNFSKDCTNFVSQALHEGGLIPFDKQRGWYCEKVLWWWNWGQAWSVADSLRYWLLSANNAMYIGRWDYSSQSDFNFSLKPGDVLFYDWDSDGTYDHSAIVVVYARDPDSGINGVLQDQHTTDRKWAIWHLKPYNLNPLSTIIIAVRPQ
ncbi:amidase domain-containing protein [Caldicellulosiruptor naganoensis]|uniref:Amidase domain-containing protein n=2 Tax=Caldicellulosiruptor naganoensis TaxID=29324 RepID=A0ABY7BIK3_9FIRM|nr:amidase domain-containing protein [Caldicellulosiruptor naganoensis]WAM31179.1 amidase domain-containing protein [Caldicellulosiruptor naganoensis]